MAYKARTATEDGDRMRDAISRWDNEGGATPGRVGTDGSLKAISIGGKVFVSNLPAHAAELRRVVDDGRTRTSALAFLNARLAANDLARKLGPVSRGGGQ
jgi:hypothetical protein